MIKRNLNTLHDLFQIIVTLLAVFIFFTSNVLSQCNSSTPWSAEYGSWHNYNYDVSLPPSAVVANGVLSVPVSYIEPYMSGNHIYRTNFSFRDEVCITDNFVFEVRLRNNSSVGGVAAYDTRVEVLGSGMDFGVMLMDALETWALPYTSAWVGGTLTSAQTGLMVDLQNWSTLKMEFNNGILYYSRDNVEFFQLPYTGNICNILGFNFLFKGSGEVDWIRLNDAFNNEIYFENFEDCDSFALFPPCVLNLEPTFTLPSCSDNQLFLYAGTQETQPLYYNWTGPNGFTSNERNPIISNPTADAQGIYTVSVSTNPCNSDVTESISIDFQTTYYNSYKNIALCDGESYVFSDGSVVTSNTIFIDTVPSLTSPFCENIITYVVDVPALNMTVSNDTSVCIGQSVQLLASGGELEYLWDSDATLSATNIPNPVATPTVTTTYYVHNKVRVGDNLVTNGDFEQGNIDFSTEYIYGVHNPLPAQPGYYTVAQYLTNSWYPFGCVADHTSGTGQSLIVDGATGGIGVSIGSDFWCQTIEIEPNTDYAFSAWLANVFNYEAHSDGIAPDLSFSINGVTIGVPQTTPAISCVWNEFNVIWNSGSSTVATICLSETTGAGWGNDFAVDDIKFYKICEVLDSVTVVVSNPVATIVDSTNVSCFGQNEGSAEVAVTGGMAPYAYSWNSNPIQTTTTATDLIAGNYTVIVTDSINCSVSATVAIIEPVVLRRTKRISLCEGEFYTLPNGNSVNVSGTYVDTILSNAISHCASIITTIIDQPSLNIVISNDTLICLGESVQLFSSGGDFESLWDADATLSATNISNPIASPTATTTYYVHNKVRVGENLVENGDFEQGNVGFSSDYIYSSSHYLETPGFYTVSTSITNSWFPGCGGGPLGSGNVILADGACGYSGVAPSANLWCQTIAVEPNTDYAFSAELANLLNSNISSTLSFSINGVLLANPISTVSNACEWAEFYSLWNSGSLTSATICISEGTGACSGNDFAVDNISFYKLCEVLDSVHVVVSDPVATIVDSTTVLCFGGNDGSAEVNAVGGITPYSYSWNSNPIQTTVMATGLVAGNYTVTVTDSINCTASASVTITEPTVVTSSITNQTAVSCNGLSDGTATVSATGGVGTHTFRWLTTPVQTTATAINLSAGTYTVEVV